MNVKVPKKLNQLTSLYGDFEVEEGKIELFGGLNQGLSVIMRGDFDGFVDDALIYRTFRKQKDAFEFANDE